MRELKILENAIKKNKSNRKIRDRNNNRVYKKKTQCYGKRKKQIK